MDLIDIAHFTKSDLHSFSPDLVIAASGYESRSIFVPRQLNGCPATKIAFCFSEHKKRLSRPQNDLFLKEAGYRLIEVSGEELPPFENMLKPTDKGSLKVLIDISVMTKKWYYSILQSIGNLQGYTNVTLRIVYCPAYFNEPVSIKNSVELKELSFHNKSSEKDIALILGMGTEQEVCSKIAEQIPAKKMYLFYPDPSFEREYINSIFSNNYKLLSKVPIRQLIGYPVDNTHAIYNSLLNIILKLRSEYKVVMVPNGPKIFSLMGMILQLSYPDIILLSPEIKRKNVTDRVCGDSLNIIDLHFTVD